MEEKTNEQMKLNTHLSLMTHVYEECAISLAEVKVSAASSSKKKACTRLAVVVTAWDTQGLRFRATVLFPEDRKPTLEWFEHSPGGCSASVMSVVASLVTSTRVLYLPLGTLDPQVQKRISALLRPLQVRSIESKNDSIH